MFKFYNGSDLIELCKKHSMTISEIAIAFEEELSELPKEEIVFKMNDNLQVMKNSIKKGLEEDVKSLSGMIGGDAKRISLYYSKKVSFSGNNMIKAISYALSVTEVNAAMGQIVAAPTAGSCGVIPGALLSSGEILDCSDEELVKALFTASALGNIIIQNATISGAEGGCQAETGSASAMAAAAIVELAGGTPQQSLDAAAMTIKNVLGLVCDPIAGLVEVPCSKRNVLATANALICADLALAGVKSIIPFDEVVESMYKVGKSISHELRETALGGLAATKTGKKIMKKIMNDKINE